MSIAEKLTTIAENEEKVFKAGEKAEYDRFWDIWQENGNRTNYMYGFAGWKQDVFLPKYPITLSGEASWCFLNSNLTDFKKHCEEHNVVIDTKNLTIASRFFSNCYTLTSFPDFDFSNCESISYFFNNCYALVEVGTIGNENIKNCEHLFYGCGNLKKIGMVYSNENTLWDRTSFYCGKLEDVRISGVIGASDISLQWSTKLSKESITSFINALSLTATGKSITFSKTAKQNAFTDTEWASLIATKPNWTISLA